MGGNCSNARRFDRVCIGDIMTNVITNWIDNRIVAALKARITNEQWLLETAQAAKWDMPDMEVYYNQANLYRKVPAISAVTDLIMNELKVINYNVKKVEGEKQVDVPNHPFELKLRKPNPEDSRSEFIAQTVFYRAIPGNCYWWMNMESEKAPPDELWIIPPHMITPVPDENKYLAGYEYKPGNGNTIFLETWEVVHFKRPNPFNRFVGLSVIEALAITAMGDIEARKWNTELFGKNNARLPGIIAFADQMSKPDRAQMLKQIDESAAKRQQMVLFGAGKGGVEWMKSASTHQEMEFLEGLKQNEEVIYNTIAPGAASMLAINSNEANARVGEAIFKNKTCYPLSVEISDKIEQKILPAYGDNLIGEFDDIRIADTTNELRLQREFSKTHTINEIRVEFYEDDPLEDERGELLLAEVGATPSGGGGGGDDSLSDENENAPEEDNEDKKEEDMAEKALADDLAKWQRKALKRGAGKAVDFESDVIPPDVHARILTGLPACKCADDVRKLFDANDERPFLFAPDFADISISIENAIKALQEDEKPEKPTPPILNINIPAKAQDINAQEISDAIAGALQGLNFPVPQVTVTNDVMPSPVSIEVQPTPVTVKNDISVPKQDPPVVNINAKPARVTTKVKRSRNGKIDRLDSEVD